MNSLDNPRVTKPNFQYSQEDFAKYDRIDWENIYKSMLKDRQLRKILKKNNYYILNTTEINQASKILDDVPLKEDLRVQYFTEHYQQNLSKYLNGQLTNDQFIYNLNFPRLTSKNQTSMVQSIIPPKIKRLNIKDIKLVLDRLNVLSNEKNLRDSSALLNNSVSTADMQNNSNNFSRMTLRPEVIKKKSKVDNSNNLEPSQLKYSIIKNMILEKFKERELRKQAKGVKYTSIKSKSQDNKLPKILHSIEAIEQEMLEKIDNKNLSSMNPKYHSTYLNFQRKLSDGMLKMERKPLSYDSKEKAYKKMMEDIKARNIMDSNLKYHINKSADGYIEALQNFKDLSRNFNKKIILKEPSRFQGMSRMSLGNIDQSKKNKNRLGLCDYLHNSNLIDQHKAGLISNIGISDMMMDKNQNKDSGVELKVKCERDLRDMSRNGQIYEKNKAIKEGEFSRLANNMFKNNEIMMKPLKRYMKKYVRKEKEENIERQYDEGNDSLQSINENKLDSLYNESINLQKRLKSRGRSSFSEKIKRLIKLEELNKTIIEVNKRKLEN